MYISASFNKYIHSCNNRHFQDKEYFLFSQWPAYFLFFNKNCIYLGV